MRHPSVMAAGSVAGVGELVERFYDWLWNAWDDNAVESTLAENLAFRGSLGQETTGRDGWRSYRDQVRRGAPNFTNFVLDLVAADDRAAARLRYIGTHRGPTAWTRRDWTRLRLRRRGVLPRPRRPAGRGVGPRGSRRPPAAARRGPVAVPKAKVERARASASTPSR